MVFNTTVQIGGQDHEVQVEVGYTPAEYDSPQYGSSLVWPEEIEIIDVIGESGKSVEFILKPDQIRDLENKALDIIHNPEPIF